MVPHFCSWLLFPLCWNLEGVQKVAWRLMQSSCLTLPLRVWRNLCLSFFSTGFFLMFQSPRLSTLWIEVWLPKLWNRCHIHCCLVLKLCWKCIPLTSRGTFFLSSHAERRRSRALRLHLAAGSLCWLLRWSLKCVIYGKQWISKCTVCLQNASYLTFQWSRLFVKLPAKIVAADFGGLPCASMWECPGEPWLVRPAVVQGWTLRFLHSRSSLSLKLFRRRRMS